MAMREPRFFFEEWCGIGDCRGSYIKNVQTDTNVVLRNRDAIFILPFAAHIQQMSLVGFTLHESNMRRITLAMVIVSKGLGRTSEKPASCIS